MNSLERYQNELIVMALLVGEQDEIINDIKEQKKLQEFYISSEILETLKKIIMENNEKCFIDWSRPLWAAYCHATLSTGASGHGSRYQ